MPMRNDFTKNDSIIKSFHNNSVQIRMATPADAEALLDIYAPYVQNTAITFEYDVPALEEFRDRIQTTLERYPYLVALQDNHIVGYAYAGAFHPRAAYQWCAEMAIYLAPEATGQGIGRLLYDTLESALKQKGILNLYACIAYPQVEDEYLTYNSVHFHEHMGYQTVGHFHQCGYKFGRWYDMIWMEKIIGERGVLL